MLTKRAEDIIWILLKFPQGNPITVAMISDELNISPRSVQRELPVVEEWLGKREFRLIRKRSVGLMLDEPEERRKKLTELLNNSHSGSFDAEDKKKRRDMLCHDILFAESPIKSYYFQDTFGISEGTLATDLNRLEGWFGKYHLTLHRRQGLGIFIEGSERAMRQAVTAFLSRRMNETGISGRDREANRSRMSVIQTEFGQEVTDGMCQIISDSEKELHLRLSDNGYQQLLVYLSYTVNRIRAEHCIESENTETFLALRTEPEFAVAEYMSLKLRDRFDLTFSEGETGYLTRFLTGIRIWPPEHIDLTRKRDFDTHQMAIELIRNVGDYLNINFLVDEKLPSELAAHLQPVLGRLRAGIAVENPLPDDFVANYADIYEACEAGANALSSVYELPPFPASEIGFITIYFAMAVERRRRLAKKFAVMIVCPTGIGSSRLLASSLKQEYPDLDVRGTASAFDIQPDELEAAGIDLIISTVKLDTPFRWICVNPVLTKQDKLLIESKLNALTKIRKDSSGQVITPAPPISRDDITYISSLGEEIFALLDDIRMIQAPVLRTREEIIEFSSGLFAETKELQQHFYEIIRARDELSDTYMKPFLALLLHGKSDQISHPCFGYVHLDPPVYENGQIILGAIVSFIPDGERKSVAASVTSEIVGALLEEPELLKALYTLDPERFHALLEAALLRFYKKQVLTTLD